MSRAHRHLQASGAGCAVPCAQAPAARRRRAAERTARCPTSGFVVPPQAPGGRGQRMGGQRGQPRRGLGLPAAQTRSCTIARTPPASGEGVGAPEAEVEAPGGEGEARRKRRRPQAPRCPRNPSIIRCPCKRPPVYI
jgi:hypothetical protein